MHKTILITGGAGFVGSHLAEVLVQQGHRVISYDNYFTGSRNNHIPGVEYIRGDTQFLNPSALPKPDLVYHLGEYSRVEQSFDEVQLVHDYNVKGTFKVLEAVRQWGCKIVYSGSSTKFADDSDPSYVMSPYAWSKAKNAELVVKYSEWFGIDFAITYFYNVYGPREIQDGNYATLIAKYAKLFQVGKKLPVVSPGIQERNFTHIDDIVSALVLIGECGSGDGYGIGHSESYTVLDVAEMFGGEIEWLETRRGNRMVAQVVTEKTKKLGWEPKNNLRDYINSIKQGITL
jgi:UDP-glucose 4-epimerase